MKLYLLFTCFFLSQLLSSGQEFLNGSFENNTAVADMINLDNATSTAALDNIWTFGSFGNIDIISSATWGGSGAQDGDWYIALTGDGTDIVSMEMDVQFNAGQEYTFSYWDRKDLGYTAFPIEIGVSDDPLSFGTSVYIAPEIPSDNLWVQRTVTFVSPIDALYMTVQMSDGSTSNWLHIDNFAFDCNLNVNLGEDQNICPGENVLLDATVAGAVYEWQDGSTNPTFNATEAGVYSVEVEFDGCTRSDEIEIFMDELPTVDLGADFGICEGEDATISAIVANTLTYEWQDGSNDTELLISEGGLYILEVSNDCGSTMDEITVDDLETPSIDLGGTQDLCEGESVILDASYPGATYEWQDGSSNSTYETFSTGTYSVELSLNGCTSSDEVDVLVGSLPQVDLGVDFTLCENATQMIVPTSSNVDTYQWQNGSTFTEYEALGGGLYHVLVSNDCGTDADSVFVEQFDLPSVELGFDLEICAGDTIELGGNDTETVNYLWSTGETTQKIQVQEEGFYQLTVSNDCGDFSDDLMVNVKELPFVELGEDLILCDDISYTLTAGEPNQTYLWHDGSTRERYTASVNEVISVEVSNECGSVSDEISIEFEDCSCQFYIPNSITVNNDGVNDLWRPISDCEINEFKLIIIDRWGRVVYESTDPKAFWDGGIDEHYVMNDVYTYMIEYRDRGPEIQKLHGTITVLR